MKKRVSDNEYDIHMNSKFMRKLALIWISLSSCINGLLISQISGPIGKSIHSHPFYYNGFLPAANLHNSLEIRNRSQVSHKNIFTGMEHHHMEVLEWAWNVWSCCFVPSTTSERLHCFPATLRGWLLESRHFDQLLDDILGVGSTYNFTSL